MASLRRLNGWQRLWVIVGIIWAIPVLVHTVASLPSETEVTIKAAWATAIVELIREEAVIRKDGESLSECRMRVFGRKSDEEIIHPVFSGPRGQPIDLHSAVPAEDRDAIDKDYGTRVAQIARFRFNRILLGFIIWALPLGAIYLTGIASRWVYQGFRQRPS